MTTLQAMRQQNMIECGFGPDVMKRLKVCRSCGRCCDAKESCCEQCGAALTEESLFDLYRSQHPVCPDCDTVVNDNARFCPICGKQLRREAVLPFVPADRKGE